MATTFVDSYTLVDSINASAAQGAYHRNDGDATLTTDSYTPSSAPVIEAALRDLSPGAILDRGYSQKALYELFLMIFVNWDNAMAALDDATLTKNDYESVAAIGSIGADYTSATIAALLSLGIPNVKKVNLYPEGMGTPEIAIACQAIASMIALGTANLDADATLNDTDYAIDDSGTAAHGTIGYTDIKFSPVTSTQAATLDTYSDFDITATQSKIKTTGIDQAALVEFLNTVVTNLNLLWVKIDLDI